MPDESRAKDKYIVRLPARRPAGRFVMIDRVVFALIGAIVSLMMAAGVGFVFIMLMLVLSGFGVPWRISAAIVCAVAICGAVIGYLGADDE